MRGRALLGAVLIVAGLTPGAGGTSAAAPGHDRSGPYVGYVACSHSKQAPKSHSCGKNQPKAAFFKSKDARVTYKICVKYPGVRQRLCANGQDAPKGAKQVNRITSTKVGKHKVKWYVDGQKVGSWTFRVRAG